MARKSKELNLSNACKKDSIENINKVHLDRVDDLYAEKHYGYYLLVDTNKSENSRKYLCYEKKVEYYLQKANEGNKAYKKNHRKSKLEVFSSFRKYEHLSKNIIDLIFIEIKSLGKTSFILEGMIWFLKYLKKEKLIIDSAFDIDNKIQQGVYNYLDNSKKINENNLRGVDAFFSEISLINNNLMRITKNKLNKSKLKKKSVDALPSSIVYQLEYFSKIELTTIKERVEEYISNLKYFNENNIFTKENILKTLFLEIENSNTLVKTFYSKLLLTKLYADYKIDANILFLKKREIKCLTELEKDNYDKKIEELKLISKCGININIKGEKYYCYWHTTLLPRYPHSYEFSETYKEICGTAKNVRTWLKKFYDISIRHIDKLLYPSNNDVYPLYLLFLIKLGLNQEVINNWEVYKDIDGKYKLKADDVGMFTLIDASKARSNDVITAVLKNDSFERRYIEFFISWNTPLYENSVSKKLFQYVNTSGGISEKYQETNGQFFENLKVSPSSFYKKYTILDLDGNRINFINHLTLRKSHNYQDFLKGKSEFQRQQQKNHKSSSTTKEYYENHNKEWKELKEHKIALSQNLIVSIFKGEITREEHKTANLIYGPMADCKNNKSPTFNNSIDLKENEYCSDWTKCLTQCNKACVVPKIHGPVIYAWINYMEKQREEYIQQKDWEKEYLNDFLSAKDTIKYFTNDENIFCESEAYKHREFVKIKFSNVIKLSGKTYA